MLEKQPKLIPSLKAAFKNRPFIFGAGIYLLTWMTIVVLETNLLIYIKYILGRQGQSSLIMASIFVTAIFALPIWNWAAKHWNKRLAYIIGVSFWAVVMIVLIMVTPQTPFWIIMVCASWLVSASAPHRYCPGPSFLTQSNGMNG